jgi:hypothetical protein
MRRRERILVTIVEPKAAMAPPTTHDPHTPAQPGCTPICTMDHTQPGNDPGWCQGPAVQCPAPAPYGTTLPGETPEPLMAARVTTVRTLPEIFGITTKLWVDVPGDVLELDLAQTDTLIDALEHFLPQLRAARAQLVETTKGDRPRNEEAFARWRAEQTARAATERAELDAAGQVTA